MMTLHLLSLLAVTFMRYLLSSGAGAAGSVPVVTSYVNAEYGYTLSYSSGWKRLDDGTVDASPFQILLGARDIHQLVGVYAVKGTTEADVIEETDRYLESEEKSHTVVLLDRRTPVTYGGHRGTAWTLLHCTELVFWKLVILPHENSHGRRVFLTVVAMTEPALARDLDNSLESLLSTLRFTDSPSK